MSRRPIAAFLAVSLILSGPVSAAPIANAASMRALAASIPDRAYYPPGYRDLRIAAAAQVAAFPRPAKTVLFSFPGEPAYYDVIDCNAEYFDPEGGDPLAARYSALALDVARIAGELRRFGYSARVYEQPLSEHERTSLARILAEAEAARAAGEEGVGAVEDDHFKPLYPLAEAMEKNRARLQPRKAPIKSEGGCGAGESAFVVRTSPANARVWVVNAFAYHVCTLRVPDPWSLQGCRWTELDPANPTMASGRYMYQARWPDGTTSRGARLFEGTGDQVETITIRK
jgi:hypothetical protein